MPLMSGFAFSLGERAVLQAGQPVAFTRTVFSHASCVALWKAVTVCLSVSWSIHQLEVLYGCPQQTDINRLHRG